MFPTEAAARAWIKEISDRYGIKLIKAGKIYIDTETKKPPYHDDPEADPDDTGSRAGARCAARR